MIRFVIALALGPAFLAAALVAMARSTDWVGPTGPYVFGTLFLGAVALFKDWLQPLFFPACLTFEEARGTDAFWITPLNHSPTAQAFFCQIRVRNLGPAVARGVSVFLEQIESLPDGPRGKAVRLPRLPLNLTWAHHTTSPFFPYIPPGLFRVCTLGHISDPFHGEYALDPRSPVRQTLRPGETCFAFETEVAPTSGSHVLPRGDYRIRLVAAAENGRKTTQSFYLRITGRWSEKCQNDMMLLVPWARRPK